MADRQPVLLLVGGAGATALNEDVAVTALRQAAHLGLRTHQLNVAATMAATPQVTAVVDGSSDVDSERPDDCVAWARERVADGGSVDVVFSVREYALPATADIAEFVGAPGNPPDAVRTARAKDACRAALAKAGFPQPLFATCQDIADARAFTSLHEGPWVVKPRDAMGSLGVTMVSDPADLPAAVAALPDGAVPFLVEQFVSGPEFSVEGLFVGGEPVVLAVTGKETGPGFVEIGHVLPAILPEETRARIEAEVVAALCELELRYGLFHVELWLTDSGIVLGEVHVRGGGDWIHLLLAEAIPGLQLYGTVFADALGQPVDVTALRPSRGAAIRFLTPPPGELRTVNGWAEVLAHPSVVRAELSVAPGDRIAPVAWSNDRVGFILVGADTAEEAGKLAAELAESVQFTVES
jgi:biotin carboxylase